MERGGGRREGDKEGGGGYDGSVIERECEIE